MDDTEPNLNEQQLVRRQKLTELRDLGIEPYPLHLPRERTHTHAQSASTAATHATVSTHTRTVFTAGILRAVVPQPTGAPEVPQRLVEWLYFRDARVANTAVMPTAQAIEIHSASAVAGPFDIPQADLERLMARAFQAAQPRTTVH